MSNLLIHTMNSAWKSSNTALLQVTVDSQAFFIEGFASNRIVAQAGAANTIAEFVPSAQLNLSDFDELRFWTFANAQADGSTANPFFLEFSYIDANDTPNEEHRWFVPVNQAHSWEQRRIGIEHDRRSAITRLQMRVISNTPFTCFISELLAVQEEMLFDLEQALIALLADQLSLPGLSDIALRQNAAPGDTRVVVALNHELNAGNRVLIRQGNTGSEMHNVTGVEHNAATGITTLIFDANDKIVGTLLTGQVTVSVVIPVVVEAPPIQTQVPSPAIVLTYRDVQEALERTAYFIQRDSFRPRGNLVI